MISLVFAAALLFSDAASAAPAGVTKVAGVTTTAPAITDKNTVVCHNVKVTGSLIPQKVCYSEAEREARAQGDRDTLNRLQSQHPGFDGDAGGNLPSASMSKH